MQKSHNRRSLLTKTAQVGISSLISKFLGIVRDILQQKFLGFGAVSDAFNIAFQIPNRLRKVFAEGALSAAFIPTLVKIIRDDKDQEANKVMTMLLMVVCTIVFGICLLIYSYPEQTILISAYGFVNKPEELSIATNLVKTLIFFIFFISTGSMLAGAMQAKNHFAVPSFGQVFLNLVYIAGLIICTYFKLSVKTFTLFIILGAILQLIIYWIQYIKLSYRLKLPDRKTLKYFGIIILKFLPCVLTLGILEVNLFVDNFFASSLPAGSITLVNLSSRFMMIALSTFAAAFSSILLSHFSRVTAYAPKRLSFYLLESSKFIFWVTIPATLFMMFFAHDIFYTTFYQFTSMTEAQVIEAAYLLTIFVSVLFVYSINKIFLTIYYSLHHTVLPTIVAVIGAFCNVIFNYFFVSKLGTISLAIGTSLSAIIQSILFVYVLRKKFNFQLYIKQFTKFVLNFLAQLAVISLLFYLAYKFIYKIIIEFLPSYKIFFTEQIGLWLWVGPLFLLAFLALYILRKQFKLKVYFLEGLS